MKIIGLTGGIACGKSTLAAMFYDLGASVIDADDISRRLTEPGGEALNAIREAFGDFVFFPNGTLNRATLASIVFANEEARAGLNAAMHPLIKERLEGEIETCRKMGALIVVLDVPLLFEAGLEGMAETIVCATSPEETQIERLKSRSGLGREQAVARMRSQWPLEEKAKRSHVVIDTDRPQDELRLEVQKLYDSWLNQPG